MLNMQLSLFYLQSTVNIKICFNVKPLTFVHDVSVIWPQGWARHINQFKINVPFTLLKLIQSCDHSVKK